MGIKTLLAVSYYKIYLNAATSFDVTVNVTGNLKLILLINGYQLGTTLNTLASTTGTNTLSVSAPGFYLVTFNVSTFGSITIQSDPYVCPYSSPFTDPNKYFLGCQFIPTCTTGEYLSGFTCLNCSSVNSTWATCNDSTTPTACA